MTTERKTLAQKVNKPIFGFIISLIAGILNFFLGLFFTLWVITYHPSGPWSIFGPEAFIPNWFKGINPTIPGAIEMTSGILIIIGAILLFTPGKATTGATLVIIFSLIGFLGLPSWVVIVGILGGVLGRAKI